MFSGSRKLSATRRIGVGGVVLLTTLFCGAARANQNVSLQWNANSDTNTAGYYLYLGTANTNYSSKIDVGNNTMATITGLSGQSVTYYFAATAYNSSRMESPPSNQAQFTTSSNSGPTLAAIPSVNGNVKSLILISNAATDPDKVAHTLTYSLASAAPPNMHLDTNTGKLYWSPTLSYGGTTNPVTLQVSDNFGLYSQQTVNIGVSNAVEIDFSPVVVSLGNTASSQVTLTCTTPVTNVSFVLDLPTNRVSNVTVSDLIPTIATITQTPAGATHSTVTIKALSGQTLTGSEAVAQLNYTAITNLPSTFAANVASSVTATDATGNAVPDRFGCVGDVVLVGSQPLARSTVQTNNQPALTLYGQAGKSFQVQSSANPFSTNGWSAILTSGTLGTNLTQVFTNVPKSSGPTFYRILAL
jgi:hypothetical protein